MATDQSKAEYDVKDPDRIAVVYGIFDFSDGEGSQLIAAKKPDAIRRAKNLYAFATAQTWGDIKKAVDSVDYKSLCRDFQENYWAPFDDEENEGINEPLAEMPFDKSFFWSDYGYETWVVDPLADMLRWVPTEIQDHFGRISGGAMFCDPQLTLDSKLERWIVNAFEKNGFDAKQDYELVWSTFNLPNAVDE